MMMNIPGSKVQFVKNKNTFYEMGVNMLKKLHHYSPTDAGQGGFL